MRNISNVLSVQIDNGGDLGFRLRGFSYHFVKFKLRFGLLLPYIEGRSIETNSTVFAWIWQAAVSSHIGQLGTGIGRQLEGGQNKSPPL